MTAVLDHRTKSARPLNDRQTYVLRYVDHCFQTGISGAGADLTGIAQRIGTIERPNSSARDIGSRTLVQLVTRGFVKSNKRGIYTSTAAGRRYLAANALAPKS